MPLDKMLESFTEAIETVAEGIRKGLFPANPGKDRANCTLLRLQESFVPRGESGTGSGKRGDKRLADYVSMAEGGGSR